MQKMTYYFLILCNIAIGCHTIQLDAVNRRRSRKKVLVAKNDIKQPTLEKRVPKEKVTRTKNIRYSPKINNNYTQNDQDYQYEQTINTPDNNDNELLENTHSFENTNSLSAKELQEKSIDTPVPTDTYFDKDRDTLDDNDDDNQNTIKQVNKDSNQTEQEELIELQFENADLQNLVTQIEDIFDVTFITDDAIDPVTKTARPIKGNKISFKTHVPLTRTQTWDLFVTFLQISGMAVVETVNERIYRITNIDTAKKLPLRSFIGTDYTLLPETDELIRFVYFVENSPLETIKSIVDALRSSASSFILLQEQKAFVLTDRAYNIKTLMEIVKNLDKVSMPQAISVMKLKIADAKQVKELYDSISQSDDKTAAGKIFTRKQPTSIFFPENMRIIAEPRTNSLILLGPQDAITKVEEFVRKHLDKEIDQPYSPLYVYQLRYADASSVAEIMNNVTKFGSTTDAGKYGSVRGIDKYMQPMSFVAEKESNRLIIKGYYDDYIKAKEIIEKLDEPQPQIAIDILLLSVNLNDTKALGGQIRSKNTRTGLLGDNVKFQTSGLFGSSTIAENTNTTLGVERILGNLLNVVRGASPGNSILTLGSDLFGVWGILQTLHTITNTQVISNPFLIATNKTPAIVSLGQERRVRTAIVVGTNNVDSFGKDDANLTVNITPQINSDGMIVLDLNIQFDEFINAATNAGENDATKNVRELTTSTIVANKEVIALGGLIRNRIIDNISKVPLLGDIPILRWLFRNERKIQVKENLLILISTRIIEPDGEGSLLFTQNRLGDFDGTLDSMHQAADQHDPIHKIFFAQNSNTENLAQNLLFDRYNTNVSNKRKRARKRAQVRAQDKKVQQAVNEKAVVKEVIIDTPSMPQLVPLIDTPPINISLDNVSKNNTVAKNICPKRSSRYKPTVQQKKHPENSTLVHKLPAPEKHIISYDSNALLNKKRTSLSLTHFLQSDKVQEKA